MKKLYAIKLRKERLSLKNSPLNGRVLDSGHHTTLSLERAVKLVKEKGIHQVEFIRHDDKTPRNTHRLTGMQMLEFWKAVENKLSSN